MGSISVSGLPFRIHRSRCRRNTSSPDRQESRSWRKSFLSPRGSVYALESGEVIEAGYQDPFNPQAGLSWRVKFDIESGIRIFGHPMPGSTPKAGAHIEKGQYTGRWGNPKTGEGPGLHVDVRLWSETKKAFNGDNRSRMKMKNKVKRKAGSK
jgi:hypothetical protein